MTFNQKTVQISLVIIGIVLILGTYFLYPKIKENKFTEIESNIESDKRLAEEKTITIDGKEANIFENVEYKGFYEIDNSFTVKSEKAHILNEEPDWVNMTNMYVTLYMNDGRIIKITSDKGKYNKLNYDLIFEKNVIGTDSKTIILAENLDLLSNENYASVYNNVTLTNDKGSLKADRINYDFNTRLYEVSMFDNEKAVKVKIK